MWLRSVCQWLMSVMVPDCTYYRDGVTITYPVFIVPARDDSVLLPAVTAQRVLKAYVSPVNRYPAPFIWQGQTSCTSG